MKPALPEPGATLGGRFHVRSRLGVGGMGAVYEVSMVDRPSERRALKLMLPHLAGDPEWSARFLREARAARVIESPYVVPVEEVGALDDGALFMVMPLLTGGDLEQELRARGRLPTEEVVGHAIEVCDALAAAHARGIIHRDLKPANIFLDRRADGSVAARLLDFGIAKSTRVDMNATDVPTLTQTDSAMGSPKYMSPEQLRSSKSADSRSDIWSLGAIVYRALSARLPFEAESIGAYASALLSEPATTLSVRVPDIDPRLEHALMRCFEKDPARRYGSVGELVTALAPFAPARSAEIVARIGRPISPQPPPSSTAPSTPYGRLSNGATAEVNTLTSAASDAVARPARTPLLWVALGASGALLFGAAIAAFAWRYPPTPSSATAPSSGLDAMASSESMAAPTTAASASPPPATAEPRAPEPSSAPSATSVSSAKAPSASAVAPPGSKSPRVDPAFDLPLVDSPPTATHRPPPRPPKGPMEDHL